MKEIIEVEDPAVKIAEDLSSLTLQLEELKTELAGVNAVKRRALESDDSDLYARALGREMDIPREIKFLELKILRARIEVFKRTEAVALEARRVAEEDLVVAVNERDRIFAETEDLRRDCEAKRADAVGRHRGALDSIQQCRSQISNFSQQLERLLQATTV